MSSELGDYDVGTRYDAKTGRPVRKRRRTDPGSDFVDSAIAVSDPEDDDDDEDDGQEEKRWERPKGDTIATKRPKKKVKLPSTSLLSDVDDLDSDRDSDFGTAVVATTPVSHGSKPEGVSNVQPLQLTFNVPKGHVGPFVVNLHLQSVIENMAQSMVVARSPSRKASKGKTAPGGSQQFCPVSKTASKANAGFLDLPAELRNDIYRRVLVIKNNRFTDFGQPHNFQRGAQLLATCRQVHWEGRSILYGENRFLFTRCTRRVGGYWADNWYEIGYRGVRKFLKAIGVTSVGLIRDVTFLFEDAMPSQNPHLPNVEARRFINDEVLLSILCHLGQYSALETLTLHFSGRKYIGFSDSRFLESLKSIRTDKLVFPRSASPDPYIHGLVSKILPPVEHACTKAMVRKSKLYGRK